MGSDDEWKDGVPPLPSGVMPASPTGNSWTPGPAPSLPDAPPTGLPLTHYPAPLPDATPEAPATPTWYAPPPPLARRSREKNWLGIASLVFGIIGGIVLALVFGLASLSAYRQGKANNRGLAIAGMAAAGGWVLLFVLVAAGTALLDDAEDTIAFKDAHVGDCFTSALDATEELAEGYYTFSPCSEGTNGIVYFITAVDSTVEYTDPEMTDVLWEACTSDLALASVDLDIAVDYYVEYYVGSREDWRFGDHTVVCGLSAEGPINYDVLTEAEPNLAS